MNFAQDAIAFTQTPETWKDLFRQRKRWARGMIESLKKGNVFTSKKLNWKSRFLMCLNLCFPFVDLALLLSSMRYCMHLFYLPHVSLDI